MWVDREVVKSHRSNIWCYNEILSYVAICCVLANLKVESLTSRSAISGESDSTSILL